MVRRVATQVHKQVTRLTLTGYIKREPLWYRAVLEHPPLPLPPRSPPNRLSNIENSAPYDLPSDASASTSSHLKKPPKVKAQPIAYLEDQVRRQFFRDHPFEAFRERTLVEAGAIEDEHPVRGAEWTRLGQRGRNPCPEDAVRFAVNLYEHTPGKSLSDAYVTACMQYRALRFEQEVAAEVAGAEAEYYGIKFEHKAIQRSFAREAENLKTWETAKLAEAQSVEGRKRWRMRVEHPRIEQGSLSDWSRGEQYIRLWKKGIRPDYSPAVSAPLEGGSTEVVTYSNEIDFVPLKPK